MKHLIVDCPSFKRDGKITYGIDGTKLPLGKADMGFISKSKTEYPTMIKAQKALKDLIILTDEKKRIHKCFHDETPAKPCIIL